MSRTFTTSVRSIKSQFFICTVERPKVLGLRLGNEVRNLINL
jgi:hypothetical protein